MYLSLKSEYQFVSGKIPSNVLQTFNCILILMEMETKLLHLVTAALSVITLYLLWSVKVPERTFLKVFLVTE